MSELEYYNEGDLLYRDMLDAIAAANDSIDIECYIFADDHVGLKFSQALVKKARQGKNVRLLVDSVGSARWLNRQFFHRMKQQGVKVRWFNPWSWLDPLKFNRRNHRKVLIVDKKIAFIGGFNFHVESSRKSFGAKRWKDAHVRFSGELVAAFTLQFNLIWRHHPRWLNTVRSANNQTKIIPNYSKNCRHDLRCLYISLINRARQSIYLVTPYFVPEKKIVQALIRASARGVDVKIMVPKFNDQTLLKYAARWYYRTLVTHGIKIFEFTKRMLHAKTMLVDSSISLIGSANMDYRSLFLNNEVMLLSHESTLADSIAQDFENDLIQSEQQNINKISNYSKITFPLVVTGYLLRKWL